MFTIKLHLNIPLRLRLLLIVTLAILGTSVAKVDAASSAMYRITEVRLFETPYELTPYEQRTYPGRFARESTRYIATEVSVENQLYGQRDQQIQVEYQYINPDGTLRSVLRDIFNVRSEWKSAWHADSWGYNQPGDWPLGRYTVRVFLDGRQVAAPQFEIYSAAPVNLPPSPSSPNFILRRPLQEIKFFESSENPVNRENRVYNTRFQPNQTRFVYTEITFNNPYYRNRDHNMLISFQYYKNDGRFISATKDFFLVRKEWETAWFSNGWGWENTGNWATGQYTVKVLLDGEILGTAGFEIASATNIRPTPTIPPVPSITPGQYNFEVTVESGVSENAKNDIYRSADRTFAFFRTTYNIELRSRIRFILVPDDNAYLQAHLRENRVSQAEAERRVRTTSAWASGTLIILNMGDLSNESTRIITVCHELVHQFQFQESSGYGATLMWIMEGSAEVIAARIAEDTLGLSNGTYLSRWRQSVSRATRRPALNELHTMNQWYSSLDHNGSSLTYYVAALATADLIDRYGYQPVFTFLKKLYRGASLEQAFEDSFGIRLADFEAQFRYAANGRPQIRAA